MQSQGLKLLAAGLCLGGAAGASESFSPAAVVRFPHRASPRCSPIRVPTPIPPSPGSRPVAGHAGWRAESLPRSLREPGGTPGAPGRLFLAGGGDGAAGPATQAEVATASSGSARRCPRGPARGGGGEGGGRARRAGRGGERAPAEAAVLIPAAKRSSCSPGFADGLPRSRSGSPSAPAARTTSGACLRRGTEVDRGRVPAATGGLARAPRAAAWRAAIAGPASPPPPLSWPAFPGHPPRPAADCDPLALEPRGGGREQGTLRSSSVPRGRRRSPAPSSLLLAELAISARFASAAMGSAVRAEALQTRQGLGLPEPLREPHFRVSRSLLHIPPLGLPPRPSGAELAVSPQRLIPIGEPLACVLAPVQVRGWRRA